MEAMFVAAGGRPGTPAPPRSLPWPLGRALRLFLAPADRRVVARELADLYEARRALDGGPASRAWLRRQTRGYGLRLLAVCRLGGEAYSVPVVEELEERTGREVAQAAVFIALRRLEGKGLLVSRLDDHAVPQTGRVRRYFKLTPSAVQRLRQTRRTLARLWEGMDAMFDEA
jgi:DNA-binding PadR family transcriptional regulator